MKLVIGGKEIEVADDVITAAIEKKESVTVSGEFVVRTTDEDATYTGNIKTESVNQGKELAIKDIKKLAGVEIEGKDPQKFIDAFKAKVTDEAGIEPTEQLKVALREKSELQEKLKGANDQVEAVKNEFQGYKTQIVRDNTFMSAIPDNTVIPKVDLAVILSTKFDLQVSETGERFMIDKTTGQPIKNDVLNYEKPETVIKKFFDDNAPIYLKGASGGAGGVDSNGGGKKSVEKFMAEMEEKGIYQGTKEFTTELQAQEKAGLLEV